MVVDAYIHSLVLLNGIAAIIMIDALAVGRRRTVLMYLKIKSI